MSAAVAFPAASGLPSVPPAASKAVCKSDMYEDVADIVLLLGVFVIGWFLFSRLSVFLGQRPRRQAMAPKEPAWSPTEAEASTSTASPSVSRKVQLSPCQAAVLADEMEERVQLSAPKGMYASPAKTAPAKAFDFDDLLMPTRREDSATPATTLPLSGDSRSDFGDFSPLSAIGASPLDLDFLDGLDVSPFPALDSESDAKDEDDVAEGSAEDFDARLRSLASRSDLVQCRRLWRRRSSACADEEGCSPATCSALAAAVRRAAASDADAELALEAAVSSAHSKLAEAALAAGARLCDAAWLARAGSRLEQAGVPLAPEYFVALARAHGREGRADLAVDLWTDRVAELGLAGDAAGAAGEPLLSELYSAALQACVSTGDFSSGWQLVVAAQWVAPSSVDGQVAMLALSRWLASHQGVAIARRCVHAVRQAGGAVGISTLRALLAASAKAGDMIQARELFAELAAIRGASGADFSAYSLMVRGFCATGNVEAALEYFRELRKCGFRADAALFDALIHGCVARNLLSVAEEVLAEMDAASVRPSCATLVALIRLQGARGALASAEKTFEELPRKYGFEPDARAYHALISACLSAGSLEQALETFAKMTGAGCPPSARTYEALITATLRSGDLAKAASLVEDSLGSSRAQGEESEEADRASGEEAEEAQVAEPQQPQQQQQPQLQRGRRAMLEPRVVEELLKLAGKRRQAASIGLPLALKLQEAGVSICDRLAESLRRAAAAERSGAAEDASLLPRGADRRAAMQRWRDGFQRLPAAARDCDETY